MDRRPTGRPPRRRFGPLVIKRKRAFWGWGPSALKGGNAENPTVGHDRETYRETSQESFQLRCARGDNDRRWLQYSWKSIWSGAR